MGIVLRHATPRKNMASIERHGLLCSKSQGRLQVVWVHAPSKSPWAALHTIERHGGRIEDVVIIEVDVPRSWLRRSRKRLWWCDRDIAPERFRRVIDFTELAGPSEDDPRTTPQSSAARVAG
jgi:hypothetical protein